MKQFAIFALAVTALVGVCLDVSGQVNFEPLAPMTMTASAGSQGFSSEHRGVFNGRRIAYRATVAETIIKDKSGALISSLVTFSYIAQGQQDGAKRPVIFTFNGGPGGSSAPLHFSGMGPKRLKTISAAGFADTGNALIDNPQCPLDVADLVFIDPTDTGFSRTYPAVAQSQLYSVDGDSESLAQMILHWLRVSGRTSSPIYLYGESYGTMRAVALARDLLRSGAKVELGGLVFSGSAITYGQGGRLFDPIRRVLALPMMASVAWHYGKIDNRSQTWEQAVEKARVFGRSEYLQALMKRYNLSVSDKDRIVRQLPAITGIPESYFREHDTILIDNFNDELLKDRGLVLDGNNGLDTHAKEAAPGEDHSRDFAAEFVALTNAMEKYAAGELGVRNLGRYYTVTPTLMRLFDQWNFFTTGARSLDITLAQVMKDSPMARILVVQGRYDTLTTLGVTEYTMDQTDVPRDRITTAYFDGGHFLIPTEESMSAIHGFLSGPTP